MNQSPGEQPRRVADLRMKPLDRLLRDWRISKALPYLQPGARVLDIGSADGAMFRRFDGRMAEGVGIDSGLKRQLEGPNWRLVKGWFPEDLPDAGPFDLITMLAVLEHIPPAEQERFARECARRLAPGGHIVITVPSKAVDAIVDVLVRMRLMRAVGIEQHWGFDPTDAPRLFAAHGLETVAAKRFQLGLNNLYVLQRPPGA